MIRKNNIYQVSLDDATHTYNVCDLDTFNNLEVDLSVTQLLKNLGFTPDYKEVDIKVLQNASKRGTYCHKALELLRTGKAIMLDYALDERYDLINDTYKAVSELSYLKPIANEMIISIELPNGDIICGSVDEFGLNERTKNYYVLDYKFTYEYHELAVQLQTLIYSTIIKWLIDNNITINQVDFGALSREETIERYCIHKDIAYKLEMKKEYENYYSNYNTFYKPKYSVEEIEQGMSSKDLSSKEIELKYINSFDLMSAEKELETYERKVKEIKSYIEKNRAIVKTAMEKNGVKTLEIGNVKYTLVNPKPTLKFNSEKAKALLTKEEVRECTEEITRNSYIKVTIKE